MKTRRRMITWAVAFVCLSLTGAVQANGTSSQNSTQQNGTSQNGMSGTQNSASQSGMSGNGASGNAGVSANGGSANGMSQYGIPNCNRASQLIGMGVQNQQGRNIGNIKDIVINLKTGKVSYVVMTSGGGWFGGGKQFAVPLSAFKPSSNHQHLVLHTSQNNISQARGIGNKWPSVQNPTFGAQPAWQKQQQNTGRKNQMQNGNQSK